MKLNDTTDEILVQAIKSNSSSASSALKALAERHAGIFYKILNAYVPDDSKVCNKKDLANERIYQVYASALRFDPRKKVKFSTFFGNEVKWLCLNCYNKRVKEGQLFSTGESFEVASETSGEGNPSELVDDIAKDDILNKIYEMVSHHPDKRVDKIFKLRYNEGNGNKVMPWKEVSQEVNLSIQGCINVHNQAIQQLRARLSKENS